PAVARGGRPAQAADGGARGDAPDPPEHRDPSPAERLAALAGRGPGGILLAADDDAEGGELGRPRPGQPVAHGDDPRPGRPGLALRQGGRPPASGPRPPDPPGRVPGHALGPDPDRLRAVLGPDALPGHEARDRLPGVPADDEPAPPPGAAN